MGKIKVFKSVVYMDIHFKSVYMDVAFILFKTILLCSLGRGKIDELFFLIYADG